MIKYFEVLLKTKRERGRATENDRDIVRDRVRDREMEAEGQQGGRERQPKRQMTEGRLRMLQRQAHKPQAALGLQPHVHTLVPCS